MVTAITVTNLYLFVYFYKNYNTLEPIIYVTTLLSMLGLLLSVNFVEYLRG